MNNNVRGAGILLHISSLPGKYGIGSMGKEARRFAKKAAKCGVKYWQILPLVQTGYGDSPYSSVSCFSGNPYFIDLETLRKEGLLTSAELKAAEMPAGRVDYGALYERRYPLLRTAFSRFNIDDRAFHSFIKEGMTEDYALFMTAKTVFGQTPFSEWEEGVRSCDPEALEAFRTRYHEEYLFWQFLQYEFFVQWRSLKKYVNSLGISVIGDIPLYVAYDSADVWAHSELFRLDGEKKPVKVAGVPPDYFSATGQLWGNPIYDWDRQRADGFSWWKARLNQMLETYDYVRIDHFRGLDRYYTIPAGAPDATVGAWEDGPKAALFEGLSPERKSRIIAEDLGVSDDGVIRLLEETGFPGMKVLLFAFDGNAENGFLPHKITENSVCYTGTHDNDTAVGYLERLPEEELTLLRSRMAGEVASLGVSAAVGKTNAQLADTFVWLALSTKSKIAVVPVQDLLGLDNSARMNSPGKEEGNWQFRLTRLPSHSVFRRFGRYIVRSRRK